MGERLLKWNKRVSYQGNLVNGKQVGKGFYIEIMEIILKRLWDNQRKRNSQLNIRENQYQGVQIQGKKEPNEIDGNIQIIKDMEKGQRMVKLKIMHGDWIQDKRTRNGQKNTHRFIDEYHNSIINLNRVNWQI
ncbi:unnamed protein product (macronuclear) [Paramecium tetraurelia]|uniref:Uncharacterized protein n=1 Tax=Paramecium tetraurelia TaxID=5888 RepID=A0D3J0_PARTE|nr:uncharacterized protein GSPATT00013095001 [Paramecium tetraurelia]CAK77607.1 unnamed protein product [Paramecium tetraurelia]|eukprot:XP_001445004.1 hypothetical protein (macronuclear) [Paramecium tetraurelia strain d4-2]